MEFFDEFGRDIRVFCDPALKKISKPGSFTPIGLGALLRVRGMRRAYVMGGEAALFEGSVGRLERVWIRHDAIIWAGGQADALVEFLRPVVPCVLLGSERRAIDRWQGQYGIEKVIAAGWRQLDGFSSLGKPKEGAAPLLIWSRRADPLLPVLQPLGEALDGGVEILDPAAAPLRALEALSGARVVVDLGPSSAYSAVLREAAARAGIPVLIPARGARAANRALMGDALRPASLYALLTRIRQLLADGNFAAQQSEFVQTAALAEGADGGWYALWRDCTAEQNASQRWEELLMPS